MERQLQGSPGRSSDLTALWKEVKANSGLISVQQVLSEMACNCLWHGGLTRMEDTSLQGDDNIPRQAIFPADRGRKYARRRSAQEGW